MLFRNYSSRHLSYGHLTRNKQRWDASSRDEEDYDKEEDTADIPIKWNCRRLPNQWRRRRTLEDYSDEEASSDTGDISSSGEEGEEGGDDISIQAQRQLSPPVAAAAQDNSSENENAVSPWGNKCSKTGNMERT